MEEIVILHTNDLHSHFENWPRIRRYLLAQQQLLKAAGKTVITLDLGDFSDRVHPLTEATDGQANTLLMNQVNYDYVTIGNNEGIGNSREQLNQLYDEANFTVLIGNVKDQLTGNLPKWAKSYEIMTTNKGTRLGFIGLTAPFPLTYNPNGWDAFGVDQVLPDLLAEMKAECDQIILLSHLGIEEERRIAQMYPEIAVILGSHTHHLFVDGMLVNEALLAAAGKFGRYVGIVTLDLTNHQLIAKKAEVQAVDELPVNESDEAEINGYLSLGHDLLKKQVVGDLPYALSANPASQNTLLDCTLKAVTSYAQVDVALLNSGLFLKTLPAGMVSMDDLHRCLPHPMHLVKVTLTGRDLLELVVELRREEEQLRDFLIVGMGFRGKIFGELRALNFEWREGKAVSWQGNQIILDSLYTFVTVDHLIFIPFFPTLREKGQIEMLFPEFIRHVLGNYFAEHYPCS